VTEERKMELKKPRLLDLCCKAGGCSVGYVRAGFEVVGVDIEPQPHYPFGFHQADALTYPLDGFDVVVASPPCQGYSTMSACRPGTAEKYEQLIDVIRERFLASGLPYVIENVEGAYRHMHHPIMLCGEMFGLRTYRHRLFESNIPLIGLDHPKHVLRAAKTSRIPGYGEYWSIAGKFGGIESAKVAMGIDWPMTDKELANAIPPVYTEWIGLQLIQALSPRRQAVRVQLCECGCRRIARSGTHGGRPGKYATDVCRVRVNRAKKAHVTKLVESGAGRQA
jgi:DNA (cytosine-5)-methyltransferase 1